MGGGIEFGPGLLELLLHVAAAADVVLLPLPLRLEPGVLFLEVGQFLLELREPLLRRGVGFLAERFTFDFELHDPPADFVEFGRHRVDLHAELRGRLVDEVDRLVGKEAVGDVPMGEHRRRNQRRVLELHLVVDLVALAKPAQDADRVLDRRLADDDRLEPALEGGVLLDALPVLVDGRRADRVQLAARQHRLEHVRRVNRALRGARAHDRVQLVDEQDDLAVRLGDLLEHGLQPLLELAAVLRAGHEGAQVEGDDALVLQALRHVAAHDALREALDDGGLADARLADEDRIVLGPAGEHLDDAADFLVAPDDRVELRLAGEVRQVAAVALERLVLAFRVLVGHALAAAYGGERLENAFGRHAVLLQDPRGFVARAFRRQRQEEMLGADELVLEAGGLRLRHLDDGRQPGRDVRAPGAVNLRPAGERRPHGGGHPLRLRRHLPEHLGNDPLRLLDERDEQVLGVHLRVVQLSRQALGSDERLLCLLGESIQIHGRHPIADVGPGRDVSPPTNPIWPVPRSVVRCSGVTCFGSVTLTVAYRSPRSADLPTAGMPCPFSRKTWPFCVVGGIFRRSGRSPTVGTSASPPSTAVVTGTATWVYRSRPFRSKRGSGVRRTRR